MATILQTQNYPDDFLVSTTTVNVGLATTGGNLGLFYADRDVVVDSIVIDIIAISGDPTSTSGTITLAATVGGTPAVPKSATFTNFSVNVGVALAASQLMTTAGMFSPPIIQTANYVKAGNWVGLRVDSVSSFRGVIQVRYRSRIG